MCICKCTGGFCFSWVALSIFKTYFIYFMKKTISTCIALNAFALVSINSSLDAQVHEELHLGCKTECKVDDHRDHDHSAHYAPIGVMGSHLHEQGEWMASYRFMFMSMEENFDGDSKISDDAARANHMATPTDMEMEMHMLGLMYAPTDKLTLMLMTNYSNNRMTVINGMGQTTRMKTSGWGDTVLSAYYGVYKESHSSAHVGLGVSAPTGGIDEEMDNGFHSGFPMQLGSGTWDLKPSVTWLGRSGEWSYGSQLSAVIRLGENSNDYTLGNRISATGWMTRALNNSSSMSLRLTATDWGNVDGFDDEMPPAVVASNFDPDARGGSRLDLSLGYSLWSNESGSRFSVEAGTPIYQKLDGPQLGVDWTVTTGLSFSW